MLIIYHIYDYNMCSSYERYKKYLKGEIKTLTIWRLEFAIKKKVAAFVSVIVDSFYYIKWDVFFSLLSIYGCARVHTVLFYTVNCIHPCAYIQLDWRTLNAFNLCEIIGVNRCELWWNLF